MVMMQPKTQSSCFRGAAISTCSHSVHRILHLDEIIEVRRILVRMINLASPNKSSFLLKLGTKTAVYIFLII